MQEDKRMSDLKLFHGPNAGYVLELYDRYRHDPASVDPATRAFFEQWTPPDDPHTAAAQPTNGVVAVAHGEQVPLDVAKIVGAARLIRYIRELGHLAAQIDPLGGEPPGDPGLDPAIHSVTALDL